ncbi:MAG TPA: HAD hydrolase family protein [Candidatus Limnocylindria bacterium]|jgi:hydroxymethylpyrimidine pyrophosphatase-like HAD family hydrolase|nr:HAD hydrolase family protein [Candidatus Limnocylindria bacterium]
MPSEAYSAALSLAQLVGRDETRPCPHGLLVKAPATGRWTLFCALTDLDGTANDERAPECGRISTIGAARDTFATLAGVGIVTGVCTARSFGEARQYREALGITGPIIAENGAVLALADGSRRAFGDLPQLALAIQKIAIAIGRPVLSSLDREGLEVAWQRERRGESPVVLGHPDLTSLRRSAERFGSCYLVGLSEPERSLAIAVAEELGLGVFGDLLHLIPRGVNKGKTLAALAEALRDSVATAETGPVTVAPIVFGNGKNDLPLFQQALDAGGAAVLVGDALHASGYHSELPTKRIPAGTITVPGVSHGEAIRVSLPRLAEFLARRQGIRFPW